MSGNTHGLLFVAPVLPLDVSMIAVALERAGLLRQLVSRWCFMESELSRLQSIGLFKAWRRPNSPVKKEHLCRLGAADLRACFLRVTGATRIASNDRSFAAVDEHAAMLVKKHSLGVFAREDCCMKSFRAAAEINAPRVYQLPTAHFSLVEKLIRSEAAEFPEAFSQEEISQDFAPERVARKEMELKAATHVLCPSTFVRDSVISAGVEQQKVSTLSLGVDTTWIRQSSRTRKAMFLYVGSVTARKGVHRLLRVWKRLGAYRTHELRLIGDMHLPASFLSDYKSVYTHAPRKPRRELIADYSCAQAFVFNALADGFGHVFAEAMACGTPVLASRNSGAPDLIDDGVEGKLFRWSEEELTHSVEWALTHPSELEEMGRNARERAVKWGWEQFTSAFLDWIYPILARTPYDPSARRFA